jgi:hypothetical protein
MPHNYVLQQLGEGKLWVNVGFATIWVAGEAMWLAVYLGLVCFVLQAACQCSQQAGKNGTDIPFMYGTMIQLQHGTVHRTLYIPYPSQTQHNLKGQIASPTWVSSQEW